jgi:hypothetical protein
MDKLSTLAVYAATMRYPVSSSEYRGPIKKASITYASKDACQSDLEGEEDTSKN